jgi:hypothetical protein
MAHRTPKEVAENAVFWTNQLNSFFEDICAQKDDPSFTHPLDLNTRSYIWEAALACRGVTRSLDYVVVSVYKLIRRRAGCKYPSSYGIVTTLPNHDSPRPSHVADQ